ncbi:unnamed protein product [Clonostachys solani]|uniref:Uncharacterized protein n=1 Tax=Clonostachys solani TaxID=160281 RepID=A0A9N9ZL61_9HYPO|nr:unnamed protein product [Clonostachys solani]
MPVSATPLHLSPGDLSSYIRLMTNMYDHPKDITALTVRGEVYNTKGTLTLLSDDDANEADIKRQSIKARDKGLSLWQLSAENLKTLGKKYGRSTGFGTDFLLEREQLDAAKIEDLHRRWKLATASTWTAHPMMKNILKFKGFPSLAKHMIKAPRGS